MKLRTGPLTLLTGSLLSFGLLGLGACDGQSPEVGYGPGKDEVAAHAAAKEQEKDEAQAETKAAPGQAHAAHGQNQNPRAHQPPPAQELPKEPSPDIKYDAPFDGAPVATRTDEHGIKIDDFVVGDGAEAVKGASVVVHYTGYLTDGTVFDTSLKRGRPFPFELGAGRVIKGWDFGVEGMKAGGKRRLIIPAEMGYGGRAAGKIPPNSTLIFTIDLQQVTPPLPDPQPLSAFEGKPQKTDKRPNGLIIEDFRIGDGAEAKAGDEVKVHYRGTLEDGTEFDNSHPRKRPITFPLGVGRVIKGWDEGIAGMKVGGLRKLVIPAELAYGERARGKIPANAQLTFLVELMSAVPAPVSPNRPHLGAKHGAAKPGAAKPGRPAGTAQPGSAAGVKPAAGSPKPKGDAGSAAK